MGYEALRRVTTKVAMTVAAAALIAPSLSMPAGASTSNPYSGSGFDESYPQCSATATPSGFAIIGVSHGRPFTSNTCAASEWKAAGTGSKSLYFNTGYALAYAKSETTTCKAKAASMSFSATGHQLSALQTAWAIGCSEADVAYLSAPGTPVAWWADVETGNSWSTNTSLNQATIDGIVTEMNSLVNNLVPVGIYSSPSMWDSIVGTSYVNGAIAADWQAGASICPSSGFTLSSSSYAPVWLVQTGTTVVKGTTFDTDLAC